MCIQKIVELWNKLFKPTEPVEPPIEPPEEEKPELVVLPGQRVSVWEALGSDNKIGILRDGDKALIHYSEVVGKDLWLEIYLEPFDRFDQLTGWVKFNDEKVKVVPA